MTSSLRAITLVATLLLVFILSKSYLGINSFQSAIGIVISKAPASQLGMAFDATSWSSPHEGWYARTTAHPSPSSFTPTRAGLALAVLRNTPVEPEGFTLALFDSDGKKDGVAVDAMGRVLIVPEADFAGLIALTRRVAGELPDTGAFRNTWVVRHAATSQPIDRLLPVVDGKLSETSVQGFVKGKTELKVPVGEITDLPDMLGEAAGLVLEARTGYERGGANAEMVQKVKDILSGEILL